MPRALEAVPDRTPGVSAFPGATAMVWPGPGHPHEAVAVPGVRLGPGDVLVELELATICPRDLRAVSGQEHVDAPLVLGHEQLGIVTALGVGTARAVNGRRIQLGDRVVWSTTVACEHCGHCRRGLPQHCEDPLDYGRQRMRRGWELSGAFATHAHVRHGSAIVIAPRDVPAAVLAPAACEAATAVAALESAGQLASLLGEIVLIGGGDLLGLSAVAMAKDAGAIVIVSESDAARRAAALAFGADAAIDPRAAAGPGARESQSFAAALRAVAKRSAVCRIALELSGTAAGARELLSLVEATGVVVLSDPSHLGEAFSLDARELRGRELTVRGISGILPRHLELAVAYLSEAWHHRPFAEQVSEPVPLARLDEALALAATGRHVRVAVAPR